MAGQKHQSGGNRLGSGRKGRSAAEKILDGVPTIEKISFPDLTPEDLPEPKEYLTANQRQGELLAVKIRQELWDWLVSRKCQIYLPYLVIDQYAMSYARWIQLQNAISDYGFVGKHPTTGNAIATIFHKMANDEGKNAMAIWNTIYTIIKENCTDSFVPSNISDPMEQLLKMKEGRENG